MRKNCGDHVEFVGYFDAAFSPDTDALVARARKALAGVDFDTMVGTGLSGTIVTPVLARAMGKHFAIVRKTGEGSHSGNRIEGRLGRRWIFVDDFISTGETYYRVVKQVEETAAERPYRYSVKAHEPAWVIEHVGTYMYDPNKEGYYSNSECERRLADGFWRSGPLL